MVRRTSPGISRFRFALTRAPERHLWNSRQSCLRHCCARDARQKFFLDRLDLQREIFGVDPALRQAAGNEPQPRLRGAAIHVPQFLTLAETPDRADTAGDFLAEQFSSHMLLALAPDPHHTQPAAPRPTTPPP